MEVSKTFSTFLDNLKIQNRDEISSRYKNITKILNKQYWASDSETLRSLQVGSYGRGTGINGISDLDMVFSLPWSVYQRFNAYETNGQSALLQEVKKVIAKTYSTTDVGGDGQVVAIKFTNHTVEVLPAFEYDDGSFKHANSNGGGSWKDTKPRDEKAAINKLDGEKNHNLKDLCKMVRAWKNNVGVGINGLLIDTLCFNFFNQTTEYDDKGYVYYDFISRDFFKFMSEQNKEQTFWYAPGSNQKVYKKAKFVAKAKKAYKNCLQAIAVEKKKKAHTEWKKIFGSPFPSAEAMGETVAKQDSYFDDTEEFIEEYFPIDICRWVNIDCVVSQAGFRERLLSQILKNSHFTYPIRINKSLLFKVVKTNVERPYDVRWKVRNVGPTAEHKNQIRGQILKDDGYEKRKENSNFHGPHFVECYIIKDGICVARDRIDVPISTESSN
jgi:Second Messenger Oligonucleotide or Dinucleotide Synthetase domain/Adenylyl/Guanylyl and SMODS C-terminal sensor domain